MNVKSIGLQEFLTLPGTIFDVRSPGEFKQARIPGALNIPLFTDDERAAVGTLYKQQGKDSAIELGMSYAGPKLSDFIKYIKKNRTEGLVKIHCWRGGMRSSSMAWLLQTAGYPAVTLIGGYKAFRRWCLSALNLSFKFIVLGGFTGSRKTELLLELKNLGEQVLDLEDLASHRGSTFGLLNGQTQPTIEQFENDIAFNLLKLDPQKPIWIEDESRMIGRCKLPDGLFHQMRTAPLIFLEVPREERVKYLLKNYGHFSPNALTEATLRLSKRLGGSRTQLIVDLIKRNDLEPAIRLSLDYYDSTYQHGISSRTQPIEYLKVDGIKSEELGKKLTQVSKNYLAYLDNR